LGGGEEGRGRRKEGRVTKRGKKKKKH
jgi:hypothetical protein